MKLLELKPNQKINLLPLVKGERSNKMLSFGDLHLPKCSMYKKIQPRAAIVDTRTV